MRCGVGMVEKEKTRETILQNNFKDLCHGECDEFTRVRRLPGARRVLYGQRRAVDSGGRVGDTGRLREALACEESRGAFYEKKLDLDQKC